MAPVSIHVAHPCYQWIGNPHVHISTIILEVLVEFSSDKLKTFPDKLRHPPDIFCNRVESNLRSPASPEKALPKVLRLMYAGRIHSRSLSTLRTTQVCQVITSIKKDWKGLERTDNHQALYAQALDFRV